jgi:hypothetical protein
METCGHYLSQRIIYINPLFILFLKSTQKLVLNIRQKYRILIKGYRHDEVSESILCQKEALILYIRFIACFYVKNRGQKGVFFWC